MHTSRKPNRAVVALAILLTRGVALADGARPWYVAPNGADASAGTLEKPFATIQLGIPTLPRARVGRPAKGGGSHCWKSRTVGACHDFLRLSANFFWPASLTKLLYALTSSNRSVRPTW